MNTKKSLRANGFIQCQNFEDLIRNKNIPYNERRDPCWFLDLNKIEPFLFF